VNLIDKYEDESFIEKRKKHIHKIKNHIHYLTGVLNEFLILTRIEESRLQIKMEEFSLYNLLHEIHEDFNHTKKAGQTVNLYCLDPENFFVNSDKVCLRHILNNLISNAIKFSGDEAVVDITLSSDSGNYIISISDNGIGIPEEEQKFIFDIFYRATNVLNIPGTGLGLNIVKKYLDAIHGQIEFKSKEGEGTHITIKLPKDGH